MLCPTLLVFVLVLALALVFTPTSTATTIAAVKGLLTWKGERMDTY